MTKINDINGNVLFDCEYDNLKDCVLEALKSMADLRGANLDGADLRGANLRGANLRGAYLREAKLSWANLGGANLREADLGGANLREADLGWADLSLADLGWAKLRGANLRGANLSWANLSLADLREANLSLADLRWANLRGANLSLANLSLANLSGANIHGAKNIPYIPLACPSDGEFTAWKKVDDKLVKLLIPATARRSSATTNKCRCDRAIVLAITSCDEKETFDEAINQSYEALIYKVGEEVLPDSYDDNRWNECSHGIHFFIDKQNAINY